MNLPKTVLSLSGDITAAELIHVRRLSRPLANELEIHAGELIQGGNAFATPQLLVTAAAVAAVINCILQVRRELREQKVKQAEQSKMLRASLDQQQVEGFEIETCEIKETEIKIRIRDRPEGRDLEFESRESSTLRIKIQRTRKG